jgi:NAD(P)-dependent dehydrogenase (short-subunit alcohol dehydrogenase family)
MFSLQNKIAIVTGAGSGIGAAIAECFTNAGALVYVAECNEEGGRETVSRIEKVGGKAKLALLDVSKESECVALVQQVLVENAGRCDALVNNAGIGHVGTILTTESADLDRLWRVNCSGCISSAALCCWDDRTACRLHHQHRLNRRRHRDGVALRLHITKHAVLGLTRAMAIDHGPTGVRINCICPGRTQTPFVDARLREYADPEEYLKRMSAPHALKRMAQPSEIAAAAVYLASDESAFVTGSAFVIDGGYTAGK